MKIHRSSLIKRPAIIAGSAVSVVALCLFGFGSMVVPSMLGHANAASCVNIENSTSYEVNGNGVNNPITLINGTGNCFNIVNSGSTGGYAWQMYQNGDGHCLWVNPSNGLLELGASCHQDNTHPNEEMTRWDNNGGWYFNSLYEAENGDGGVGTFLAPSTCAPNQTVYATVYSACPRWFFPS